MEDPVTLGNAYTKSPNSALIQEAWETWGLLGSPEGVILNGKVLNSEEEKTQEDSRESGTGTRDKEGCSGGQDGL